MRTSTATTTKHSSLATRRLSHILAVFRRQGMRLTQARGRAELTGPNLSANSPGMNGQTGEFMFRPEFMWDQQGGS